VPVRRRPSRSRGAAAAAGGYAGAARLGLAWPIGAASSAPHFPPATADPAAHFSCAGPSRGVRRCRGLCALSGPTAGCWAGCVLAAAPLVRSDQLRAARKGRSRCGEFLRRQVLVCARIFGAPVRKPFLLQLLRATGRAAGRARALAGYRRPCPEFCGLGRLFPPAHCSAGDGKRKFAEIMRMLS